MAKLQIMSAKTLRHLTKSKERLFDEDVAQCVTSLMESCQNQADRGFHEYTSEKFYSNNFYSFNAYPDLTEVMNEVARIFTEADYEVEVKKNAEKYTEVDRDGRPVI